MTSTEPPRTVERESGHGLRDYAVGFVLAFLGGVALMGLATLSKGFGYVFCIGVPLTMGAVLGYSASLPRTLRVFTVIFLVLGVVGGGIMAGLAGVLCGVITAVIALVPTLLGAWAGSALRRSRHARGSPPGPVVAALLLFGVCGVLLQLESRLELPHGEETVTTTRVLEAAPDAAWELLVFYEEVDLEPPAFARIGLPHPLRTEGRILGVGDVKRCVYSSGYLTKRITVHEPGRRLGFDVVEQVGIEDRSVELLRGSFEFEPLPDGRTLVTLTTVYRPLLAARSVWRPFEQSLAHVLHDHVLDGMELETRRERGVVLARAQ